MAHLGGPCRVVSSDNSFLPVLGALSAPRTEMAGGGWPRRKNPRSSPQRSGFLSVRSRPDTRAGARIITRWWLRILERNHTSSVRQVTEKIGVPDFHPSFVLFSAMQGSSQLRAER